MIFKILRVVTEMFAKYKLERNKSLIKELKEYLERTGSTGCNYTDYFKLYQHIRKHKPLEILECGTGASTVIIAFALKENYDENKIKGRVTSMESHEKYFNMQKDIFPNYLLEYTEMVLSNTVEDYYSIFRGVRYEKIPEGRSYDFIFVDGPSYESKIDRTMTFNFDLIHIVRNSKTNLYAIVDKRISSCFVYQKIFGLDKVRYNAISHLCLVGPLNKYDLLDFDKNTPSKAFIKSFRFFGNSKLNFYFTKTDD